MGWHIHKFPAGIRRFSRMPEANTLIFDGVSFPEGRKFTLCHPVSLRYNGEQVAAMRIAEYETPAYVLAVDFADEEPSIVHSAHAYLRQARGETS